MPIQLSGVAMKLGKSGGGTGSSLCAGRDFFQVAQREPHDLAKPQRHDRQIVAPQGSVGMPSTMPADALATVESTSAAVKPI